MTTKFVGMKEFRQNIASYTQGSKIKNIRIVVLKKNVPVFEVKPIDEGEFVLEKLQKDIAKAREDVKNGNVYTHKQMMNEFGLN
ncbi:MAG: hypothetical protein AAB592_02145 [Patescibacteria group bacterium]